MHVSQHIDQANIPLSDIIKGIVSAISMEDLATKMKAKQVELDEAVKRIERLDIEAQEKSKFSYVR